MSISGAILFSLVGALHNVKKSKIILHRIANIGPGMYQEEVEYEASRLSKIVEPILLACLGILVLIMMLGIFLSMLNLGEVALHKVH